MMKKSAIVLFLVLILGNTGWAQPVEVPFNSDQWEMSNGTYSFQQFEGKESLLLQSGFIYIKDLEFLNGTIELDINFSSLRNFPGVAFRIHSPGNFEEFYFRPHQSGNPDANQYTPIFNGLAGWQLYHGDKFSTAIHYTFNEWHHLKIEVKGNKAVIYFDDMEQPLLAVNELKHGMLAGTLGLMTLTNVHFANFQYTIDSKSYSDTPVPPVIPEGQITSWQLSGIQNDRDFKDKLSLTAADTKDIKWQTYPVQSTGALNIAQYLKLAEGKSTAVAKLSIRSNSKQIKKFELGYSDFVSVYVNGQILYSGANNFRSRDYRYLGTIGYFDAVYLPLKKGDNEVLFVVRENFGGWGVQAVMPDQRGVAINDN
jgi:hypothetical protein